MNIQSSYRAWLFSREIYRVFTLILCWIFVGTVVNCGLVLQFKTENFREFSEAKVHWPLSLSVQGLLKA